MLSGPGPSNWQLLHACLRRSDFTEQTTPVAFSFYDTDSVTSERLKWLNSPYVIAKRNLKLLGAPSLEIQKSNPWRYFDM